MIVPAAVVTFALGTSFQTNAFKAGNSYMAYAEVDPGTVTVTDFGPLTLASEL